MKAENDKFEVEMNSHFETKNKLGAADSKI